MDIHMKLQQEIIPGLTINATVQLILVLPVQFGVGLRFYRAAWAAIKHGNLTMDSLIVLGSTSAFVFSLACVIVNIVSQDSEYSTSLVFETSAMVLCGICRLKKKKQS